MYAPLASLGVLYLKRPYADEHRQRQMELLLAIGIWAVLQAAAVAYSRGANGAGPIASRYMDILALGALANAGAVVVLVSTWQPRKRFVVASCFLALAVTAGAGFTSFKQVSSRQEGRHGFEARSKRAGLCARATKNLSRRSTAAHSFSLPGAPRAIAG